MSASATGAGVDPRQQALDMIDAAWSRGQQTNGQDTAIPIQLGDAIVHALIYVGDQLAAVIETRNDPSLRSIVEHIAGMVTPEAGREYGAIASQLILDAREALREADER